MKKEVVRRVVLLLTGITFFATIQAAQAKDWEHLGDKTVERRADRDEIVVTAKEGKFSKIKLKVRAAGVEFRDVKVHFVNGEVQDVELRRRIPAGGETRDIDLPGGDRRIRKVVFFYKTRANAKRRAVVALWGKH